MFLAVTGAAHRASWSNAATFHLFYHISENAIVGFSKVSSYQLLSTTKNLLDGFAMVIQPRRFPLPGWKEVCAVGELR
jgi:hypothetical protein